MLENVGPYKTPSAAAAANEPGEAVGIPEQIKMAGMIRYRGYGSSQVKTQARAEVVGSIREVPEDRTTSVPPPPTYEMARMHGGDPPVLELPPLKDRTMFPI